MPVFFEVQEDRGIIHIRHTGELTPDDLRTARGFAARICTERGFTRVLVDVSGISGFGTVTAFDHASILSNVDLLRLNRQAIVVSEQTKQDLVVFEHAAMSRGVNVKLFESREQALIWLSE